VATLILGGYLAPLLLLVLAVVPGAIVAGIWRQVFRTAAIAALPIAIAVGLVSTFGLPGEHVLVRIGPFIATLEGLDAAGKVTARLFVMAAGLALFGLTTPPRALVADLERRGVSPRVAFVAAATLGAVPALVDQARLIRDAQRARGLDVDGGLAGRLSGVVPLFGPVILGTLQGVEARALALEARAFGRPGRRDLLWAPADSGRERLLRWAIALGVVAVLALSIAGALPQLP
jgi:energy-coupling factor transport system permease protein